MIFTETKILVHFLQQIPGHHHHFLRLSMTMAVFLDFPGLKYGLTKFYDFPRLSKKSGHTETVSRLSFQTDSLQSIPEMCCFNGVTTRSEPRNNLHPGSSSQSQSSFLLDWRMFTSASQLTELCCQPAILTSHMIE